MPQLAPSAQVVSYSRQEVNSVPSGLGMTLEHLMMQPGWQAWPIMPTPPRVSQNSAIASPEILAAPSKRPSRKLRVGRAPASLMMLTRTAVP